MSTRTTGHKVQDISFRQGFVKCDCGEVFRNEEPTKLADLFGVHVRSKFAGKRH